ncbi:hypothetical protein GCM10014719_34530 [Planomonospora parontospora subsp. antibiotica]|nr:hypothetical protein GCM10014719_34530 [Planomonospora parontospora subsp. antibiotica]
MTDGTRVPECGHGSSPCGVPARKDVSISIRSVTVGECVNEVSACSPDRHRSYEEPPCRCGADGPEQVSGGAGSIRPGCDASSAPWASRRT